MTQPQLEELLKVRREAFKSEMTRITKLEGITPAERRALHKACKEDYHRRNEELQKNDTATEHSIFQRRECSAHHLLRIVKEVCGRLAVETRYGRYSDFENAKICFSLQGGRIVLTVTVDAKLSDLELEKLGEVVL